MITPVKFLITALILSSAWAVEEGSSETKQDEEVDILLALPSSSETQKTSSSVTSSVTKETLKTSETASYNDGQYIPRQQAVYEPQPVYGHQEKTAEYGARNYQDAPVQEQKYGAKTQQHVDYKNQQESYGQQDQYIPPQPPQNPYDNTYVPQQAKQEDYPENGSQNSYNQQVQQTYISSQPQEQPNYVNHQPQDQQAYSGPQSQDQQTYAVPQANDQQSYGAPQAHDQQSYSAPQAHDQQSYSAPQAQDQQSYAAPPSNDHQAYAAPQEQQSYSAPQSHDQQSYAAPLDQNQQNYVVVQQEQPQEYPKQETYASPPNQPYNQGAQDYNNPPKQAQYSPQLEVHSNYNNVNEGYSNQANHDGKGIVSSGQSYKSVDIPQSEYSPNNVFSYEKNSANYGSGFRPVYSHNGYSQKPNIFIEKLQYHVNEQPRSYHNDNNYRQNYKSNYPSHVGRVNYDHPTPYYSEQQSYAPIPEIPITEVRKPIIPSKLPPYTPPEYTEPMKKPETENKNKFKSNPYLSELFNDDYSKMQKELPLAGALLDYSGEKHFMEKPYSTVYKDDMSSHQKFAPYGLSNPMNHLPSHMGGYDSLYSTGPKFNDLLNYGSSSYSVSGPYQDAYSSPNSNGHYIQSLFGFPMYDISKKYRGSRRRPLYSRRRPVHTPYSTFNMATDSLLSTAGYGSYTTAYDSGYRGPRSPMYGGYRAAASSIIPRVIRAPLKTMAKAFTVKTKTGEKWLETKLKLQMKGAERQVDKTLDDLLDISLLKGLF